MNKESQYLKIVINKKLKMIINSQKLNIMRPRKISKNNYKQNNNKYKIKFNIIINL